MGSAIANIFTSRATEKAADRQVDGIENAQRISQEAANQARNDALALFDPAFSDITTSLQQARDDLIAGRRSSQDILNQAFSQASSAYQTGQQQSINALLGVQGQPAPPTTGQPQPNLPIEDPKTSTGGGFRGPAPITNPAITGAEPAEMKSSPLRDVRALATDGAFGGFNEDNQIPEGLRQQIAAQTTAQPAANDSAIYEELDPLRNAPRSANLPDAAPQAVAPEGNYGLAGAESAIREALTAQEGALTGTTQQALGSVNQGFNQARGDITGQLDAGLSALRSGVATGRGDITSARDAAIGYLDPYQSAGQSALDREAALTGALGAEAQQAAFDEYNLSPGQQYFRDQQEQALLRNQSATGGLGSGNVLTALQEQAQGIASQQYQQDLENLRSLAGRGQQAATTQGGYQQTAGSQLADLAFQGGAAELGARQQAGSALSQLAANRGLTSAQIQQGLGTNLSNIYGQAGSQVSGLRGQAGRDIAAQLAAGGQGQADLISQLGGNLANIDQQTATNIANLAAQQGQATSGLRTGLASLLSNLATGTGTQQANLAVQLGGAEAAGVTNPVGNTINQLLGLLSSSAGSFGG